MAGEMLLINPRRRKARRAAPAKRRRVARRRNPVASVMSAVRRRRRNPIAAVGARRRRRNPALALRRTRVMGRRRARGLSARFGKSGMKFYTDLLMDAAIGGAGSVGMDYLMAQVNPMLPESLQPAAANISANDAVRAVVTAFLGKLLAKPSKGLSIKAARGALTVQVAGMLNTMIPAAGALSFYSPARIVQGTNRVGPIRSGVNAYLAPGKSPLLNRVGAYTQPGRSPLLSGARTVQQREGVSTYY